MYRFGINIYEKKKKELCVKLVIYKNYTEMHGQQNIKFQTTLIIALRYKSEGRGFDSRWCHWNFLLT